jgi:hypothetical protein
MELPRTSRPKVVGGLGALAIAAVVYSQFNLYAKVDRDSAIYLYGGQWFAHGVPPYASIMDPKGPLPGILCGFGVAVARLFGRNDVLVVRAEFATLSILSALGIYLLVLELWHSAVAGVVAAAVFTSFKMYGNEALSGPDGHTPGIVFIIFAMWLTVRRQWYWAGFAASLAFFSWQPLFPYPLIVLLCAAAWSPGQRLRAAGWSIAGGATPLVLLFVYYAAEGYPRKFFEGTFLFPLRGVYRARAGFGERLHSIFSSIPRWYGSSALLLWIGLSLLLVMAVWTVVSAGSDRREAAISPIVLLLVLSLVTQVAYVLYDYIGWPHVFPLLPYAAAGFGAAVAHLLHRLSWRPRAGRVATAALLAAVTALTAFYAVSYYQPSNDTLLLGQKASSCALERSLPPGKTIWSIDNPIPLVLLHRRNPDNYPYVGSGLAKWKVKHTRGGFAGWTSQIGASAAIVAFQYWSEHIPIRARLEHWLRSHGYHRGYIGQWNVYLTDAARARMAAASITLTRNEHVRPLMTTGATFRTTDCTGVAAG